MFKSTTATTPEEYLAGIEEPRRSQVARLDAFIRETVPELEPFLISGMLGYGPYHYRYKSGREGDWAIVALANQKKYISLYVSASDGEEYVAEKYKERLPKASIGKSCVRFKRIEDVDFDELANLLREGAALARDNGFAM